MTVQPNTKSTAEQLGKLEAGERAWFWCCPYVEDGFPILLVHPLSSDPKMHALRKDIQAIQRPDWSESASGILQMGEDGRCRFTSSKGSDEFIEALAEWVVENQKEHPSLALLYDAVYNLVNDEGTVVEIFQDNTLWDDVVQIAVPGTLSESANFLRTMEPNKDAWFWMSDKGPGGYFLALQSVEDDPEGKAFSERVRNLRLRSGEKGMVVRGVARRNDEGVFVLTTTEQAKGWQKIISHFLATYGAAFQVLKTTRLMQMKNKKVVGLTALQPWHDLSTQVATIRRLKKEKKALFWFTSSAANKKPLLLLDYDKDNIKKDADRAGGDGKVLRGRITLERRYVAFHLKKPVRQFLTLLAQWVIENHSQWSTLRRLRGSRLVVGEKDYQDPSLWEALK